LRALFLQRGGALPSNEDHKMAELGNGLR